MFLFFKTFSDLQKKLQRLSDDLHHILCVALVASFLYHQSCGAISIANVTITKEWWNVTVLIADVSTGTLLHTETCARHNSGTRHNSAQRLGTLLHTETCATVRNGRGNTKTRLVMRKVQSQLILIFPTRALTDAHEDDRRRWLFIFPSFLVVSDCLPPKCTLYLAKKKTIETMNLSLLSALTVLLTLAGHCRALETGTKVSIFGY